MSNPDNACLWQPSLFTVQNANLTHYINYLNKNLNFKGTTYSELYQWSIENLGQFWSSIWDYCGIISQKKGDTCALHFTSFNEVKWFPDSLLNYTENLLRKNDDDIAFIFQGENKYKRHMSWKELHNQISSVQQYYKSLGIKKGDRIAFFMPNIPQTVVCVLAAASIGAISSLCSPDFGVEAVCDRFGQIEPALFVYVDEYIYNGKFIQIEEKAIAILKKLSSINHFLRVSYQGGLTRNSKQEHYENVIQNFQAKKVEFEYVSFDHPLYIMYSSGTTGVPKCIVHGVGGTLIQHLKEHVLHCDFKEKDVVYYFTTCGWMMWQWLIGALACKTTLLLYDGSPFSPNTDVIFEYLEEEKATFFGTSAKYLDTLKKNHFVAKIKYQLKNLRMIASTGSPLLAETFDYVYENIKSDVCLSSISGGTDIISCFVLGNPIGKVYRGEIQAKGLGMAVAAFNEKGESLIGEKGELVCTLPFPCAPIYFWNDEDRKKYHASYFSRYENIWHHGDWIEITQHGGVLIYGRSDTTLNPGGVRIGTAEIYRQVEQFDEIIESVVVEQKWQNDTRVILFVVMKENFLLDNSLIEQINKRLKIQCSPRHVPAKIISVPALPRTRSGKIVEIAVKYVINNQEVMNKDAMANPEALVFFQNLPQLLEN